MITIKKYAAIDIGSNAIRLLIANILEEKGKAPKFTKNSLIRVPIRLGSDTFESGEISEKNIYRMIDAMNSFKLLMNVHEVEAYKACATSAMRDAKNGDFVVDRILKKSGIKVDIIDGKVEADIIAATDLSYLLDSNKAYLYVDVGGGSTEMTVYDHGKIIHSKSFKLGTVRLLKNNSDLKETWNEMKKWVKSATKKIEDISIIGSGGNINTVYTKSGYTDDAPLSYVYLKTYYEFLKEMTYEERISKLNLNPDRADVIIPATNIYLSAMKWTKAQKIYVPKIGLADGIVKSLYAGTIQQS